MVQRQIVRKKFKVVGLTGSGAFTNFGTEVPALAQQFLIRSNEIENRADVEIALYEPKKGMNHVEGHYIVGMIVTESVSEVPSEMEYIELDQHYVTMSGKITNIEDLHVGLLKFADEIGYKTNLESYIVETFHPMEGEIEEVEVYLPICLNHA